MIILQNNRAVYFLLYFFKVNIEQGKKKNKKQTKNCQSTKSDHEKVTCIFILKNKQSCCSRIFKWPSGLWVKSCQKDDNVATCGYTESLKVYKFKSIQHDLALEIQPFAHSKQWHPNALFYSVQFNWTNHNSTAALYGMVKTIQLLFK